MLIKFLESYISVGSVPEVYPKSFEPFEKISGLDSTQLFPWHHLVGSLPEIFFISGMLGILIYISYYNTVNSNMRFFKIQSYKILLILLICVIFLILFNPYSSPFSFTILNLLENLLLNNEWQVFLLFHRLFILDYYSVILKLVILCFGVFFLALFKYYIKFTTLIEYPILISFLILGLILLVQSFDLITMYLSLELIALTSYILASFAKNSIESLEAGIKYVILGSIASALILLGIMLLYGSTSYIDFYNLKYHFSFLFNLYNNRPMEYGIIDFCTNVQYDLASKVGINTHYLTHKIDLALLLGCLFINLGFLFKLSAAPFHMWTPDVYEGSSIYTTAVFATVVKIAIFGFYLRLIFFLFYDFYFLLLQPLLLVCGLISVIWGSLGGLSQIRLKRLFAYSGIVNTGFLLLGLTDCFVDLSNKSYGFMSVFLYTCFYFLASLGIFIFLISLRTSDGEPIDYITDLRGFAKIDPFHSFLLAIILLSLAGVPPFVGFLGKLGIFISLWNAGYAWVLCFLIFASVISSFYYLRLIKIMFFDTYKVVLVNKKLSINSFYLPSYFISYCFYLIPFLLIFSFFTPNFFIWLFDYNLLEFNLFYLYKSFPKPSDNILMVKEIWRYLGSDAFYRLSIYFDVEDEIWKKK